jgi:hypothetical protein
MSMRTVVVTVVLTGCVLMAGAQEKKITRDKLPAAVAATVDRETTGASIKGYTTEREHGNVMYEAQTVVNGKTRDIEIAQDGTVNEVEEQVDLGSLPAKVQQALQARAQGSHILKVEALSRRGKLVAYEATTVKNGKHGEFQVAPDGNRLAHEED